ncbi:hypothetical protein BDZ85DRAFT_99087 [Elsinoe ampelina]|uniref:Myb-like domain-containing protein n=1 Tax=Elsinoe ampelina TaxID=302913 RepID=A0A6A6GEV4_9PEZI|nr:hypothetical protein BDZ85DRAFT_99087 [Elsinoe ampelina]
MLGTPFRRHTPAAPDPELQRDRARNDAKLKSRFERIFEKYNKDFSQVGDEIDLRTGRVVVDNGHLSRMQNERDPGSKASKQFVRAFTQELGADDHQETRALNNSRRQQGATSALSRSFVLNEDDDSEDELQSSPSRQTAPSTRVASVRPANLTRTVTPEPPQLSQQSTSLTTVAHAGASSMRPLDPNSVQSLGQALANQIASFLNQQVATNHAVVRNDPWAYPSLPSHRAQPAQVPATPGAFSEGRRSVSPTGNRSLWATGDQDDDDDFGRAQPARKKRRYHDSIAINQRDDVIQSVETEAAADAQDPDRRGDVWAEQGRMQMDDIPEADSAPQMEVRTDDSFLESAQHNFQMLAHGFVNRGFLKTGESKDAAIREPSPEPLVSAIYDSIGNRITPELYDGDGRRLFVRAGKGKVRRFTKEEDLLLVQLKEKEGLGWPEILRYFPDRTESSISVRYSRSLKFGGLRYGSNTASRLVELDDHDATDAGPEDGRAAERQSTAPSERQVDPSISHHVDGHMEPQETRYNSTARDPAGSFEPAVVDHEDESGSRGRHLQQDADHAAPPDEDEAIDGQLSTNVDRRETEVIEDGSSPSSPTETLDMWLADRERRGSAHAQGEATPTSQIGPVSQAPRTKAFNVLAPAIASATFRIVEDPSEPTGFTIVKRAPGRMSTSDFAEKKRLYDAIERHQARERNGRLDSDKDFMLLEWDSHAAGLNPTVPVVAASDEIRNAIRKISGRKRRRRNSAASGDHDLLPGIEGYACRSSTDAAGQARDAHETDRDPLDVPTPIQRRSGARGASNDSHDPGSPTNPNLAQATQSTPEFRSFKKEPWKRKKRRRTKDSQQATRTSRKKTTAETTKGAELPVPSQTSRATTPVETVQAVATPAPTSPPHPRLSPAVSVHSAATSSHAPRPSPELHSTVDPRLEPSVQPAVQATFECMQPVHFPPSSQTPRAPSRPEPAVYDFPLDPALREQSPDLEGPPALPTPGPSPDDNHSLFVTSRSKSNYDLPIAAQMTPLQLFSIPKRLTSKNEMLRSSVLRRAFSTPQNQKTRAPSVISTGSATSTIRSGPVPVHDASDDELS